MTLHGLLEEIRELSVAERKQLIGLIVDTLTETVASVSDEDDAPSILELEGLGAEIWSGVNADEYVRQLRDEWD